MSEFCVIGSGPAAVSAAMALTRKNVQVTMLDAGVSLDPDRKELVGRLRRSKPQDWSPEDVSRLKDGVQGTAKGIPLKKVYGSDHPFRAPETSFTVQAQNTGIKPSFAKGGLSTVWGAGLLPFHESDFDDWPFGVSELEPHYRDVLSFVPCAACPDDLADMFPLFCDAPQDFKPSRQAEEFFRDTARAKDHLRKRGVRVGRSRLAVDVEGKRTGSEACEYCGMCLYGCAYEAIYNSEYTLRSLQRRRNFRYIPDFVVEELRESGNEVLISGRDRQSGKPRQFHAGRVFLGAGVIPSTAILLRSMQEYDVPIRIQDSLYFLLPMLRFKGVDEVDQEGLHTLAQAFVIIQDEKVSPHRVQLSVYMFNDLLVESMKAAGGPAARWGDDFWREMGSRILVCGGYLHSKSSPGVSMRVERNAGGGVNIVLEGEPNAKSKSMVRRVGLKLLNEAPSFRAVPLVPFIKYSEPGRGFHSGASFPMQKQRGPHSSDDEGRPFGFDRVHLVDASCFPSIPASPVTLSVMANAHRIATLAAQRGV